MNTHPKIDETATDLLFAEMRQEKNEKGENGKTFKPLPDGTYHGRVYILAGTVGNQDSPNYARRKYIIELIVTEGEHQGKMAYHHRVIQPSYLGNQPPDTDTAALTAWQARVKEYLRRTDDILRNCGVDTSDTDMNRFVEKIAANNVRHPVVNSTVRKGVAYVNHVVDAGQGREVTDGGLFDESVTLPDGNDLVLA